MNDKERDYERLGREAAIALEKAGMDAVVSDPREPVFARAALAELTDYLENTPALFRNVLEGAERGASQLTVNEFDSIMEIIQNADDQNASFVDFAVRKRGNRHELLALHDGNPIEIKHVAAMTLAFVTTKSGESEQIGKFGIGLKALTKVSDLMEVHCSPYHFSVRDGRLSGINGVRTIRGFNRNGARHTLLRIRLRPEVNPATILDWFRSQDSSILLFLNSVNSLRLLTTPSGNARTVHRLEERTPQRKTNVHVGREKAPVSINLVTDPKSGRSWRRFAADFRVPRTYSRQFKAIGDKTRVSVAVPTDQKASRLFAGLPTDVVPGFPAALNGAFDTDTARRSIQQSDWNSWVLSKASALLAEAAIWFLGQDPDIGWNAIPLRAEVSQPESWFGERCLKIVKEVQSKVSNRGRRRVNGRICRLKDLSYETADLSGILTDDAFGILKKGKTRLPEECRDKEGRWRRVLNELSVPEIEVGHALRLFSMDDARVLRTVDWFASLASAAIRVGKEDELTRLPCLAVVKQDSTKAAVQPEGHKFSINPVSGLASQLGIIWELDPGYTRRSGGSEDVIGWLRDSGSLVERLDSLELLRAIRSRGRQHPIEVSDVDITELREVVDEVDAFVLSDLGKDVGQVITVRAFEWVDGRRVDRVSPIADCCLSSGIEREKLAWSTAAGKVPGINWISPHYASVLNTGRRATGVSGARRFFTALGARSGPKVVQIVANPVPKRVNAGKFQRENFASLRSWPLRLRGDHVSTELTTVVDDIQKTRKKKDRLQRGIALFTTLSRQWTNNYESMAKATAETRRDARFSWSYLGEVPATWIVQLAQAPWLQSVAGQQISPSELHLNSPANELIFGRSKNVFVAGLSENDARSGLADTLGIRVSPRASHVIDLIRQIRTSPEAIDETRVRHIYAYLATLVPSSLEANGGSVDDVPAKNLKIAFGGRGKHAGLILANGTWNMPSQMRRGRKIFGGYMNFVSDSTSFERLWDVLRIQYPDMNDCIKVLDQVAESQTGDDAKAVVFDTYRWVNELLRQSPGRRFRRLETMPIWDGREWSRQRPVYWTDDEMLNGALSKSLRIWAPPCPPEQLPELVPAAGIVHLPIEHIKVRGISPESIARGMGKQAEFSNSIYALQNILAREHPQVYNDVVLSWQELANCEIAVLPDLKVEVVLPNGARKIAAADGHASVEEGLICLRDESGFGIKDIGGKLVSRFFEKPASRAIVPLAWFYAWQSKRDVEEDPIELAPEEDSFGVEPLGRIAEAAGAKKGRRLHLTRSRTDKKSNVMDDGHAREPRLLKQPEQLEITRVEEINKGSTRGRVISGKPPGSPPGSPHGPKRGSKDRGPGPRPKAYSEQDKEQLALELPEAAIREPANDELRDLTGVKGVGADAIDELKRLFEIKAHGGEIPDSISIQASQVQRALHSGRDFFVAVFGGLEDDYEATVLRVFATPLSTLDWESGTQVHLKGVNSKHAVEIVFQPIR